jgi:hypothetical protein
VLNNAHGEEWWRKGVPLNIRKECAARNQEAQLTEEWKLSEMLFIDFHTYAELINKKKKTKRKLFRTRKSDGESKIRNQNVDTTFRRLLFY